MSENQTDPQSLAKLHLRFETKDGPRVIVASNITVRDASLIAAAMMAAGHHAEYHECGELYSLAEHMAGRRPLKLVRRA
jgi:hypothetical protein